MKWRGTSFGALLGAARYFPLRLSIGRWLTTKRVPWALRRLGAVQAQCRGQMHPYLFTLGEQTAIAETLKAIPAGAIVQIPQWFVGTSIKLPGGATTFMALTEYYQTTERADRERRKLAARYPSVATFGVICGFDPGNREQRAQVIEAQRRAVRGE